MNLNVVSLEKRIENIRSKYGDSVSLDSVANIVSEVMGSIDGSLVLSELHFQDELKELLAYIEKAKADLGQIQPKDLSENKIPEASNQLDEVVNATEEAATKIMDAAEELGEVAGTVDGELAEKLENISMKIFEASSFQDITGQRVTKVVNTLKHLEEKLSDLAKAIGDTDSHLNEDKSLSEKDKRDDKDLLQGPQSEAVANDQDAIDALFDSF